MKKNKLTIILCILNFIYSVFLVSMPIITKELVDTAILISTGKLTDYDRLYIYIIILVSVVIMEIIIKLLENYLYLKFSLIMEIKLKKELYESILTKKTTELDKYHTGQIQQLFMVDIENIIRVQLETIPGVFRQITRIVLAIILLLFIDPVFLIFVVICGAIGFFGAKLYSKVIRPRHKHALALEGQLNGYIGESIENIKLLKANTANSTANEYFNNIITKQINAKKRRNDVLFFGNGGIFTISNIIYLTAITYGTYMIAKTNITYGTLIALIQLLSNIQTPILSLSSALSTINLAKASEERINNVKNLENDIITNYLTDFDKIIFDNVTFSYDKIVHENLSFEINKGETVLISGPSGIGKTTIFMLLLGFITPQSGNIYIEHNNKKIELNSSSRTLFSYVPQENILFSGTIKDNIYILTNNKNEDEIIKALKLVNIYDEILKMPKGLNTVLLERGSGLSLGQIQRIMIAIAVIKNKEILLLDEFSSALDNTNESLIMQNLKNLNKTIIYITHRNNKLNNNKTIKL